MIAPKDQWCIHVEVTNACGQRCANCTRLVAHVREPFFVSIEEFRRAVTVLAPFVVQPPDRQGRKRTIGMMGGEPLLHPQFPELVDVFCEVVPDVTCRGLWTGLDWPRTRHADAVRKLLGPEPSMDLTPRRRAGFINWNRHGDAPGESPSYHQSPLVAVRDVVPDPAERQRLIDQCWMQEEWSSCITPQGFFFCEIAAAMAGVFDGPRGLDVLPGCWSHPLSRYTDQQSYCERCGFCLYDRDRGEVVVPDLPHRLDADRVDDVSRSNLADLARLGSPRILAGEFCLYEPPDEGPRERSQPWLYRGRRRDVSCRPTCGSTGKESAGRTSTCACGRSSGPAGPAKTGST
jgi:hypothetical protein